MTTIRKIVTSKIDGNSANSTNDNEIRPFGETAFYVDETGPIDKLVLAIHDGVRTNLKSKVVGPGVLYGSNADAGDDSGADTIKLIPDATLHNNGSDQYIVVDPTSGEPGHIHVRAGGAQDASTADLYLGGEQNFVRISDTNNSVTIKTTFVGSGESTYVWDFNSAGVLTFPNSSQIRVDEGNIEVGGMTNFNVEASGVVNIYTDTNGETPYQWQFGDDGSLTLPGDIHGAPVISGGAFPSQVGRTVNITPADDASDKKFKFRIDQYGETFTRSYLELPTAEVDKQVAAVFPHTNNTAGYIYTQGADTFDDRLNNAFNIFYNAGDIKLTAMTPVAGTLNTWKFGSNGDLTLPGNLQSESNINIDINLSDSTLRRWRFGEDGDLTLPGSIKNGDSKLEFNTGGDTNLTLAVGNTAWQIDSAGFLHAPNQRTITFYDEQGVINGAIGGDNLDHVVFGASANKGIKVFTDGATNLWTFGTDGSLTLPNDGVVSASGSGGLTLGGNFDVKIIADYTDNDRTWTFNGSDGSVTFPDNTTQTTAYIDDNVVQVSTTGGFSDDAIIYNLGVYQFKMTSGHLQIRLLAPAGIVVNAWVSTVENINEIISGNNTGLLTLDESNWVTVTGTPTAAGGDTIVATVVSTQEGKMYRVTAFRSFTSSAHMVSRETLRG